MFFYYHHIGKKIPLPASIVIMTMTTSLQLEVVVVKPNLICKQKVPFHKTNETTWSSTIKDNQNMDFFLFFTLSLQRYLGNWLPMHPNACQKTFLKEFLKSISICSDDDVKLTSVLIMIRSFH